MPSEVGGQGNVHRNGQVWFLEVVSMPSGIGGQGNICALFMTVTQIGSIGFLFPLELAGR
jgi:hypothetical protein